MSPQKVIKLLKWKQVNNHDRWASTLYERSSFQAIFFHAIERRIVMNENTRIVNIAKVQVLV